MSPSASRFVPLSEVVTVGLPFCAFKILTGLILLATPGVRWLGYALILLGAIDLALNLVNLASLALRNRRLGGVCLTDILQRRSGRGASRQDLGIAFDVFLSFGLVALVIGFGLLSRLPKETLPLWNVAVVLNVLGAGIGRLLSALRRHA